MGMDQWVPPKSILICRLSDSSWSTTCLWPALLLGVAALLALRVLLLFEVHAALQVLHRFRYDLAR